MNIRPYIQMLLVLSLFSARFAVAQTILEADGPGDTYELINSALAPGYDVVENPECIHPEFGRHIAEVWDSNLNQYVFEFYIHVTPDNDRCIYFDRQRMEIKTYEPSPDNLKGVSGETVRYKWKFKIPVGFQPSSGFTHIHQVKAVGGNDDNPLFTLTPRKGTTNKMELIYNNTTKVEIVNLSLFEGIWVEATETIKIDSLHGSYSITIKKVSDGTEVMSYINNDLMTIRSDNNFIRPKWGIYRSLATPSDLRDEAVRFAGFYIAEAPFTYTWNRTGTGSSWTTSTNWTPARIHPLTSDIIRFNSGVSSGAANVTTQTIGQLLVSNNTSVKLSLAAGGGSLTIKGEAGVDLDVPAGSALEVTGVNLTLAAGTTSAIGGNLTTNGTLAMGSGSFTVASGASLITNGAVSGNVTVERAFAAGADAWHLFCLPTSNGFNASPLFDGAFVDSYSENMGAWNRLITANSLNPKTGYSVNFPSGSHTLAFTGTLNTGNQSFSGLSYTTGTPGYGAGWHLVGNPFPSAVDLDIGTWTKTNLNGYVYVWDGSQYVCGPTTNGTLGTLTGNIIPAMQGFFVKATSSSARIVVPQASRVHSSTFYKNVESASNSISLNINGNGHEDKAVVSFNPLATVGFDSDYDAYKLFGITEAPQLYSILVNEIATVNSLPSFTENPIVPLGLKVGTAAIYSLNVYGLDNFDASVPVLLEDIKLGIIQDLRINPVYSFSSEPNDNENRFNLLFASVKGVTEQNASGIHVYSANGIIHITQDNPSKGTIFLYSASGQLVANSTLLTTGETTIRTKASGMYTMKVVTSKTILTQKVVVTQ